MTWFLVLVLLIGGVGVGVLAYRNRPESSIESGIHAFRREMRALAPPSEQRRMHDVDRDEPPHRPGAP